jgi:hypothetical protein
MLSTNGLEALQTKESGHPCQRPQRPFERLRRDINEAMYPPVWITYTTPGSTTHSCYAQAFEDLCANCISKFNKKSEIVSHAFACKRCKSLDAGPN